MPKVIKPAGFAAPLGLYSPGMAVAAGEIVAVAGMTGIDGAGQIAGADVGAQTKQALANVKAVVEAAGCTMRDVIRLQTFLTSADDIAGFMKARQDVFAVEFPGGPYPTNTLLVVSALRATRAPGGDRSDGREAVAGRGAPSREPCETRRSWAAALAAALRLGRLRMRRWTRRLRRLDGRRSRREAIFLVGGKRAWMRHRRRSVSM